MKQYSSIIILLSFFTLTNCENVVDCIINVRPELSNNILEVGEVDRFYYDKITAQIKNEPNDNNYDYYFDIVGEVPRGLDIIYNYREVAFEGVPLEAGRFSFKVYLDVESYNNYYYDDFGNRYYDDELCTNNTQKTYTIIINN